MGTPIIEGWIGGEGGSVCLIVFLSFLLLVAYLKDIALEHRLPVAEAPAARSCDRTPVAEGEQHHEKPLPSLPSPRLPPPAVVVIIDGTWSQAKQILSRYPSLSPRRPSGMGPGTRGVRSPVEFSAEPERDIVGEEAQEALCRAVMFRSAGPSGYGFRREPSRECISTLESVAYSLEVHSDSSVYPSPLGRERNITTKTLV